MLLDACKLGLMQFLVAFGSNNYKKGPFFLFFLSFFFFFKKKGASNARNWSWSYYRYICNFVWKVDLNVNGLMPVS